MSGISFFLSTDKWPSDEKQRQQQQMRHTHEHRCGPAMAVHSKWQWKPSQSDHLLWSVQCAYIAAHCIISISCVVRNENCIQYQNNFIRHVCARVIWCRNKNRRRHRALRAGRWKFGGACDAFASFSLFLFWHNKNNNINNTSPGQPELRLAYFV